MPKKISQNSSENWNIEFDSQFKFNQFPRWPNEMMVKSIFGKGNYFLSPYPFPDKNWKVLEVGCGFANNLLPFADIGARVYGVDIDKNICRRSSSLMSQRGYSMEFSVGTNTSLPFENDQFDLVLSVGTIHYEGTETSVNNALKEFNRVLKKDAFLYIETTGPKHNFFKNAESIGNNEYLIKNFDFRDDQKMYFFENLDNLHKICGHHYRNVQVGNYSQFTPNFSFDAFIALMQK
jgi:ubiquinone/menaquinone biosynthesis C-methylase UbiE